MAICVLSHEDWIFPAVNSWSLPILISCEMSGYKDVVSQSSKLLVLDVISVMKGAGFSDVADAFICAQYYLNSSHQTLFTAKYEHLFLLFVFIEVIAALFL